MSIGLGVYESGQQSFVSVGGHPTTLFAPQQAPVCTAMGGWPQPLKYLAAVLECWSPRAPFLAIDIYDGGLATDPADQFYNQCRSYRTHSADFWALYHDSPPPWGLGAPSHNAECFAVDTSDATTFYPSQPTLSGPFGDPMAPDVSTPWYWADARQTLYPAWVPGFSTSNLTTGTYSGGAITDTWSVSDEWDMTAVWGQMQTFLAGIDLDAAWVYTNPSRPHAHRVYGVNLFAGGATDLSAVPPGLGSGGAYDGQIYSTGQTGFVNDTAQIQGAAFSGNGFIWSNTGLHMAGAFGGIAGNYGTIYTERVQVKFNLPIAYAFVEVLGCNGTTNQMFYKSLGTGALAAETVLELPQPTLFPGAPAVFTGASCRLAFCQSTVLLLVNQTAEDWASAHGLILYPSAGTAAADSDTNPADSDTHPADS